MIVHLWMPYMLMLIWMTLTLMQGHNGSAKVENQHCMLSATKQAISISIKLDLDFVNVYMACPFCFVLIYNVHATYKINLCKTISNGE